MTLPPLHSVHTFRYLGVLWAALYCVGSVVKHTAVGITPRQAARRATRKANR